MNIGQMLALRHAKDAFIEQCRNGPATGDLRVLDAWVLLRTWSPITTIGYEIKTARQDFLRDEKWPSYLPLCHLFYWVCPSGLIQAEEVAEGCGLLWAPKNGSRLVTKRKAVRRDIPLPGRLMVYALMSRARIVADMWQANAETKTTYWRAWLAEKAENQELGRLVGERIRRIVDEQKERTKAADRKVERYEDIRRWLTESGFDADRPPASWDLDRKFCRPERELRMLYDQAQRMLTQIEGCLAPRKEEVPA